MQNKLVEELVKILGKANVLTTPEDLAVYGYDGTFQEARPEVVVLPESTAQLSEVVKLAAATRTPVVPRGMGSGLAAGSIPLPPGGMVLSMTRMNRILEIDEENATVHAEAGVVTADLQAAVEKRGLFYPPDPSSIRHSTIGGNVACNAGGPRCLKYGVTGDYVLGLTVVLADGRILVSLLHPALGWGLFLMNGKAAHENPTFIAQPGQRVRLRIEGEIAQAHAGLVGVHLAQAVEVVLQLVPLGAELDGIEE